MQTRRHAAIMFTDIVGYTALMGSDEDKAFDVLRKNREIHSKFIKQFHGTLIKELGDGMLISFELASEAVRCAIEIQKETKSHNIPLKIGIHEGEMVFEGNDVLGDGVNIAARIQDSTEEGCLTISASVYRDIKNLSDIKTEFIGEKKYKNVDEPVRVYQVIFEDSTISESHSEKINKNQGYRKSRGLPSYINNRNAIIMLLSVLVVLLVYPKLFRNDKFEGIRDLDGRISIAVMQFKNMTGDSLLNVWQEGIQNLLITSLSNSSELSVRQYETMHNIFKNRAQTNFSGITPSIASDIALKLDAGTVIIGNIFRSGNTVRVTANLLNSSTEEIYKSYEINGNTEDDFFAIADSLSTLVKNYLEIKILEQDIYYDLKDAYTQSADAYKYYIQAFSYHGKLNYNSAIELYNKAIAIDTNFVSAMLMLSYSYGDIGQSEQSKKWAYKAYSKIDNVPLDIQLSIEEVKAAVDKRPLDQIRYMKQYLEINPYCMNKMYGVGWASFNTEQWQNAIDALEKNAELLKKFKRKSWIWTYVLLGQAYHMVGEHKKESEIFDEGLLYWPDEKPRINHLKAICFLSKGDSIAAKEKLDEIETIGKQEGWQESEILLWLASTFDEAGNLSKAEELYRNALLINTADPELANELAYFLISNEININEGFKLIEHIPESVPHNGNYLHTYGLGLYKSGKLKEAQEALTTAWDLIPYYDHDHFTHIKEVERALALQN